MTIDNGERKIKKYNTLSTRASFGQYDHTGVTELRVGKFFNSARDSRTWSVGPRRRVAYGGMHVVLKSALGHRLTDGFLKLLATSPRPNLTSFTEKC